MNYLVKEVTKDIIKRSRKSREKYLEKLEQERFLCQIPQRTLLPSSNLAHELASCQTKYRNRLSNTKCANIAIISSYNELVSSHEPFKNFPEILKQAVFESNAVAQFAGGIPAMCDGITQGQPGMELSLISRDVIAMSVAIALCHRCFDGAFLLGVCDKIFPGMLMGALAFGYMPMLFVPSGPMKSGLPNKEKAKVRELFALKKITKKQMLEYELKAYHSPGTCTFYGTANSNQLIAEMLGLHLPGSSFVNADTPLRKALTREAGKILVKILHGENTDQFAIGKIISEKSIVNAMVGILATGASTNETIHLVAIAKAAGIIITWEDFSKLSDIIPLIVKIYPNGPGDINSFQKAGGTALLFKELIKGGFLNEDVQTIMGKGLSAYTKTPFLKGDELSWGTCLDESKDPTIISSIDFPFDKRGGIKLLKGNLGKAIMKISSLKYGEETVVEAPALVFETQEELEEAFKEGRLDRDFIAVVRFQGPRANGMPELHKLITYLSIIMDKGYTVGLVTDGRLSGASGKVPFAIHLTPEAAAGGLISKVRDEDLIKIDAKKGTLELKVPEDELKKREPAKKQELQQLPDYGRSLFKTIRGALSGADKGATSIFN